MDGNSQNQRCLSSCVELCTNTCHIGHSIFSLNTVTCTLIDMLTTKEGTRRDTLKVYEICRFVVFCVNNIENIC